MSQIGPQLNAGWVLALAALVVPACSKGIVEREERPQAVEAAPQVRLATEYGDIVIALDQDAAPMTSENFIRYVGEGHYESGAFYRVVRFENDRGAPRINVIQGGLNTENAPFPNIAHESTGVTGLRHTDGVISMARMDPGTAASEFFISIGDNPSLDFGGARNPDGQGFAAFGQVVEGMEAVRQIHTLTEMTESEDAYVAGQMLAQPVAFQAAFHIPE